MTKHPTQPRLRIGKIEHHDQRDRKKGRNVLRSIASRAPTTSAFTFAFALSLAFTTFPALALAAFPFAPLSTLAFTTLPSKRRCTGD
jgi:hypothetical protein